MVLGRRIGLWLVVMAAVVVGPAAAAHADPLGPSVTTPVTVAPLTTSDAPVTLPPTTLPPLTLPGGGTTTPAPSPSSPTTATPAAASSGPGAATRQSTIPAAGPRPSSTANPTRAGAPDPASASGHDPITPLHSARAAAQLAAQTLPGFAVPIAFALAAALYLLIGARGDDGAMTAAPVSADDDVLRFS